MSTHQNSTPESSTHQHGRVMLRALRTTSTFARTCNSMPTLHAAEQTQCKALHAVMDHIVSANHGLVPFTGIFVLKLVKLCHKHSSAASQLGSLLQDTPPILTKEHCDWLAKSSHTTHSPTVIRKTPDRSAALALALVPKACEKGQQLQIELCRASAAAAPAHNNDIARLMRSARCG